MLSAFWIAAGVLIGCFVLSGVGAGIAQQPKKKPDFRIVFDNRYDTRNPNKRYQNVDIYVMDIYGQHVRRLTADHLSHTPSLSPDGKQIAYIRDEEPFHWYSGDSWDLDGIQRSLTRRRDLFEMDADGKNVAQITSAEPDVQDVLWLPDGKRIALRSANRRNLNVFLSHGKDFDTPFDRVDTVEGVLKEYHEAPPKQWHDPVLVEFFPATDNFLPLLSLHWGKFIAGPKEVRDLQSRMTFLPELSASLRLISITGDTVRSPVTAFDAAWSPDGKRIAYSTFSDKNSSVLSVSDLKDGLTDAVRVVTPPELEAHAPVWSADGSRLAFTALWKDSQQIFLVNADGSGLVRLSNNIDRSCAHPSWSPDGQWVVAECKWNHLIFQVPYVDAGGWYSGIYLFKVRKPGGTPRVLMDCGDYPRVAIFGADWQSFKFNTRCGAHNPSFVPVATEP